MGPLRGRSAGSKGYSLVGLMAITSLMGLLASMTLPLYIEFARDTRRQANTIDISDIESLPHDWYRRTQGYQSSSLRQQRGHSFCLRKSCPVHLEESASGTYLSSALQGF